MYILAKNVNSHVYSSKSISEVCKGYIIFVGNIMMMIEFGEIDASY